MEQERREQRRYAFLERLYLLAGGDANRTVTSGELERELEVSAETDLLLVEELARLGYVYRAGSGEAVGITAKGIEYAQQAAWRRRSIRDNES
jgi:Mn-dependent DtxR family transcriptional regulator